MAPIPCACPHARADRPWFGFAEVAPLSAFLPVVHEAHYSCDGDKSFIAANGFHVFSEKYMQAAIRNGVGEPLSVSIGEGLTAHLRKVVRCDLEERIQIAEHYKSNKAKSAAVPGNLREVRALARRFH